MTTIPYLPTLAEIAAARQRIQARWTQVEREARAPWLRAREWSVEQVSTRELVEAGEELTGEQS